MIIEDPGNLPRYAIFRGKKVRVLGYVTENQRIVVLDSSDHRIITDRTRLKFLKGKK